MLTTDLSVICIVELALTIFTIYAGYRDYRIKEKDKRSECSAKVNRGRKSMASIYTVYSSAMASLLVLINNTPALEGNKVILIVWNFILVTYAFFFSTWFRNLIFFPLIQRARED